MIKKINILLILVAVMVSAISCASLTRKIKDVKSDFTGGLNREVNVYTMSGEKIATYKGKIDIEENADCSKVKFELDGKRYIYYNCMVEAIEIDDEE